MELYRAEAATATDLPPVLVPDYTAGEDVTYTGDATAEQASVEQAEPEESARRVRQLRVRLVDAGQRLPPEPAPVPRPVPQAPRLERSLMMRGELTVPRSGYTEPYTVW